MMIRKTTMMAICAGLCLTGCAASRMPQSLGQAITDSRDLATVREGLPAYLIALDGAVLNYPKNEKLLRTAATLNGTYGSVFVDDPARQAILTGKSLDYARRQMCRHSKKACGLEKLPFDQFETVVKAMKKKKDVPALYSLASAWAGYIQQNAEDWDAIADLGKVELMMKQVVDLEPDYEQGQALLYMGVLNSLVPPSLGGKPEVAKTYFEKAIAASQGHNLIVKVKYAETYARLLFDKDLHDRLLKEVLDADPEYPGMTLQNVYAQDLAKKLLAESNDYF